MSYFIFHGKLRLNQPFTMTGDEAVHIIRSRRIRPGEKIQVQDTSDDRYRVVVERIDRQSIDLYPVESITPPAESNLKMTLFQGFVKEKATDYIIQKTTELGVTNIVLFQSRYSQRVKTEAILAKRLDRWRKIALEACKQSGRWKPPNIYFLPELAKFQQFCHESSIETKMNICSESSHESVPLSSLDLSKQEINVFVGPEGGWDEDELKDLQATKIHLGPRTLRSDTAAISIVSLLQYLNGDM